MGIEDSVLISETSDVFENRYGQAFSMAIVDGPIIKVCVCRDCGAMIETQFKEKHNRLHDNAEHPIHVISSREPWNDVLGPGNNYPKADAPRIVVASPNYTVAQDWADKNDIKNWRYLSVDVNRPGAYFRGTSPWREGDRLVLLDYTPTPEFLRVIALSPGWLTHMEMICTRD